MTFEQVNIIVAEQVLNKLVGYEPKDYGIIHAIADDFENDLMDREQYPASELEVRQEFEKWFVEKIIDPAYTREAVANRGEDNYWDSLRAGLDPETGEEIEE
jgi:hypothetical protein